MDKKFFTLGDVLAYKRAFALSNYVWKIILTWNKFSQDTVGKQFVKATDSISANISEGFGRYTKKDKVHFFYYSLGSVHESLDWNQKSKIRGLITETEYEFIFSQLQLLPKEIYYLINYTNKKLSK